MTQEAGTKVVVNADDFGFSRGVNRGIFESIENGIVTSTSVMVDRAAAPEATQLMDYSDISVGLHLDMTEEGWRRWTGILWLSDKSSNATSKAIERNFKGQVERFTEITGQLPDHIDSHHHVHMLRGVWPFVRAFSEEHNIPVRSLLPAGSEASFIGRTLLRRNDPKKIGPATFEMGFFGRSPLKGRITDFDRIGPANLIRLIEGFRPGIHEVMCHPGYVDEELRATRTPYLAQRAVERQTLTNPKVKEFIDDRPDITLINWKEVAT